MNKIIAKIKKLYFKAFLMSGVNEKYIKEPARFESIVSADPKKIFLIVLAFNRPDLIALHDRAIKKFLRDEYEYFIMDNSSKDEPAEEIKKYCLEHKINYVRLPHNPGLDESINPGLAFNWIYRNLIERFKPERFGFIDSDLFPTETVSFSPYLEMGDAWGIVTDRQPTFLRPLRTKIWYLWLGLLFFRTERFAKNKPNFLPGERGIDAGGRVRIDPEVLLKLPDVHNLHDEYKWVTVAPNTEVIRYGKFVHFTGASWKPNNLENQKRWLEGLLNAK